MARTPIKENTFASYAMRDSRAEGYVTYFTKMGWDRWKMAAEQVAQDVETNKANYSAAVSTYQQQLKDIADARDRIGRKMDDVALKQANAQVAQEMFVAKENAAREKLNAAKDTEKEQKTNVTPSSSRSQGTSLGGGGGYGRGGSGKDIEDELRDEVSDTTAVNSALSRFGGLTKDNAQARFDDYAKRLGTQMLPGDSFSREVTSVIAYNAAHNDLVAQGMSQEEADKTLYDATKAHPDVQALIVKGQERLAQRVAETTGGGAVTGQRTSSSVGAKQEEYDVAHLDLVNAQAATKAYDDLSAKLEEDLAKTGVDLAALKAPVMEPLDLITSARKTYMDKFGNVPTGTNLKMDGKVIAKYKNLAPFEITNAMHKTEQFFKMYIDDAVSTAKKHAVNSLGEYRDLNVDELNAAIEQGKKTARDVLFGGLSEREKYEASRSGTVAPPNAADIPVGGSSADIPTTTAPTTTTQTVPSTSTASTTVTTPTPGSPQTGYTVYGDTSGGVPTSESLPGLKTSVTDQLAALYPEGIPESLLAAPPVTPALQPPRPQTQIPLSTMKEPTGSIGLTGLPPLLAPIRTPPDIGTKREGIIPDYSPTSGGKPTWEQLPGLKTYPPKQEPPPKQPWKPAVQPGLVPAKTPDQVDQSIKTGLFLGSMKAVKESPKAVANKIVGTSTGKYVAALYDENKAKGDQAKPLGELTSQVIREYAGDDKKQKSAVQRLLELSLLDIGAKRLS